MGHNHPTQLWKNRRISPIRIKLDSSRCTMSTTQMQIDPQPQLATDHSSYLANELLTMLPMRHPSAYNPNAL